MRLSFFSLLFLVLAAGLRGHVVDQFYGNLLLDEDDWSVELLFDVGYATEEERGNIDSPPPSYGWLVERSADEFAQLREGAESYLRECLGFYRGGEVLEVDYHFYDFDKSPPEFHQNVIEGAYFRVRISAQEEGAFQELRCALREGERPDFVFGRSGKSGGREYVILRPGEDHLLMEAGEPSLSFVFRQGFEHVIPLGLDHVLFILALFLAGRQKGFLLQQSLIFTLAHSLTLGLAAAGVISAPATWLEPAIALSIMFLAAENLWLSQSKRRRFPMIFIFGLLHGLGFAAVLQRFLVPGESFLIHLAVMNLGVELAQLCVLMCAWLVTIWIHKSPRYERFTRLSNILLILVAGWWFFERISL